MKIAIQLPANPRSFKRNYPFFIKTMVETLNPDIFIHTWRLHGHERPDVITDGTCEEYIELYKPKLYKIEDLYYNYEPLNTMVPHFISRYKTNQLRLEYEKQNNIKYDVVIGGRPDVRLLSPFKMEYAEMVKEDQIWIHHFRCGAPTDYFFYTTPKWMNIITEGCFNNLDKLKLDIFRPGAERLLQYILDKEGFKHENFKFFGTGELPCDGKHYEKIKKNNLFDIECIR
jgi:hypothetical protein